MAQFSWRSFHGAVFMAQFSWRSFHGAVFMTRFSWCSFCGACQMLNKTLCLGKRHFDTRNKPARAMRQILQSTQDFATIGNPQKSRLGRIP
jgi:hypothetical protein